MDAGKHNQVSTKATSVLKPLSLSPALDILNSYILLSFCLCFLGTRNYTAQEPQTYYVAGPGFNP